MQQPDNQLSDIFSKIDFHVDYFLTIKTHSPVRKEKRKKIYLFNLQIIATTNQVRKLYFRFKRKF